MKTGARVAWLSSEQAAQHLGFPGLRAFYRWLEHQPEDKPRRYRIGRRLRFRQTDLDACVEIAGAEEKPAPLRLVPGGSR